jgi:hypothetical protein
LLEWAQAQLAAGALRIEAVDLEAIELGPLQVLLCAAAEARRRALPCELDMLALPAMEASLAAVRLPGAASHFTLTPLSDGMANQ